MTDEEPFVPIERTNFEKEIGSNKLKSVLLIGLVFATLFIMLFIIGEVYSPNASLFFFFPALLFSGGYVAFSYFYGDKIVLSTTGAMPIDPKNPKHLFLKNTVENLAFAARLPKTPDVYVIESDALNAFATGRDPKHASVAVTSGLLNTMNRSELEGVLAHEISHVQNYDIRFALLVAVMVGLIAILAELFLRSRWYGSGGDRKGGAFVVFLVLGLILAIFAPIFVRVVQAAVSRKRELLADASGAKITRHPEGLASALEKIRRFGGTAQLKVSEAESHLFFDDPVRSHLDGLFATHPSIEERIRKLRAM